MVDKNLPNQDLFETQTNTEVKTADQQLSEWQRKWLAIENKTAEQLYIAFVEEHKCQPSEVEIVRIISADNMQCRIFIRKREPITL